MENEGVKMALQSILNVTEPTVDHVHIAVARWFDDAMIHVSAGYKRKMQPILFGVAIVVTIVMNVDSIHMMDRLWKEDGMRRALSQVATNTAGTNSPTANSLQAAVEGLELPFGWNGYSVSWEWPKEAKQPASTNDGNAPTTPPDPQITNSKVTKEHFFLYSICGWLVTAIAASLGAPFWFDLLNKVVNLRSAVQPKDKKEDKEEKA